MEELQQKQLQEPFYFHSSSSVGGGGGGGGGGSLTKGQQINPNSIFTDNKDMLIDEDWNFKSTGSILAPLTLCLLIMVTYIILGSILFVKLESWPFTDCCFFCFMSLSTINLTDLIILKKNIKNTTVWLCSIYILTGLALTAMCFNILHEELLKRLKRQLMSGLYTPPDSEYDNNNKNKKKLKKKRKMYVQAEDVVVPGPDLYTSSSSS
ncbi:hypothetical protein Phum_PHUM239880 [Pediculus humanus corporis]|uniref:Potassium channel domain-containing protein n=1 Tax=Pediculus humanus subsp. corporis TaxID=121224 RepID=E0VJ78_PEDHC|nr:uncharacterized protein Phum_PHUM239880 [Pediculus humanus corporis]EEB13434.1 hypothetical protein Phum_PHUM239880 [Pediculus humanus corporis]